MDSVGTSNTRRVVLRAFLRAVLRTDGLMMRFTSGLCVARVSLSFVEQPVYHEAASVPRVIGGRTTCGGGRAVNSVDARSSGSRAAAPLLGYPAPAAARQLH